MVPNRGVPQNVQANNAWISFLNHDGSVHTARWIGIANPGPQRANSTPPLVLNEPLGSDIVNGVLYLADRDGGTAAGDPSISVVRTFNMKTGLPMKEYRVEKSTGFNDIAIDKAGNIYGTRHRRRAMVRRYGRSRRTVRRQSSCRARRSRRPTAWRWTTRATLSWSTSAALTC